MKNILFGTAVLFLTTMALQAQRMVVVEHFTQWNCPYCPPENTALDEMVIKYPTSLAAIRYHGWWPGADNDPFYLADSAECIARINYYGVFAVPWDVVDGSADTMGYYNTSVYEPRITAALARPSPIDLSISVAYDTVARNGTVTWTAKAVDAVPAGDLRLRIVIAENEVDTPGGTNGEVVFNQVMRDMVGDQFGDTLTLSVPGDSITRTKTVHLDDSWDVDRCAIVIFIQDDNIPENNIGTYQIPNIYQGAKFVFSPHLVQQKYILTEVGNNDGYYEPGESGQVAVWVLNKWCSGTNARVVFETTDPYVTITNGEWNIGTMNASDSADNSGTPFSFQVSPSATMPEGHTVKIAVKKEIFSEFLQHTITAIDTVSFLVGLPATFFSEDFETGLDGWGKGYIGPAHPDTVFWDTTSLEANSGTFCITDSRDGFYQNSSNNYIKMTSGLDLRGYNNATLIWWDKYSLKSSDNCKVQVSTNGGGNWATPLQQTGTQTPWTRKSLDLASYCGTVADFRIRFMLSANSSDSADGWYVDDVAIMGYTNTGVASRPEPAQKASRTALTVSAAFPNPTSGQTIVEYQIEQEQRVVMNVYDITGRLVRTLTEGRQLPGRHQAVWNGTDHGGSRVANGIYFVRVETGGSQGIQKVVLIR